MILITQNPGIAKRYATRMITFRDGEVIEDTNPLKEDLHQKEISLKRTHMKIYMAIKLAIRDISNKKLRMFFYVLISSIGIMGIALIIALLQGFNKQISGYENDTLANYPIVINKVYTNYSIHNTSQNSKQTQNDLKNSKLNTKNDIIYSYNSSQNSTEHINQVNKLREDEDGKVSILDTSTINLSSYPKDSQKETYLEKNYELLYGYYPTNKNEVVLIVDEKNRLDTNILNALGIDVKKNKEIKFDDLIGKEYKIILNDEFYKKQNGHFYVDSSEKNLKKLYNSKNTITISITAILRAKEDSSLSNLPEGISYSNELCNYYIDDCKKSDIVKSQQDSNYNVITGQTLKNSKNKEDEIFEISGINILNNVNQSTTKNQMLSSLGASLLPSSITIYPKNFESKSDIIEYLDNYNKDKNEDEKILYKDTSTTINKLSTNIMKGITIVLVVFATLIFFISLITIFILTYASVLERKTEVCILRVLGGKKRDIVRLFNTENIIIGFLAGILGVFLAYTFIVPMNYGLEKITDLSNVAILKVENAIVVIAISVILTFIGGFIPAKIAARKDPVEFLKNQN